MGQRIRKNNDRSSRFRRVILTSKLPLKGNFQEPKTMLKNLFPHLKAPTVAFSQKSRRFVFGEQAIGSVRKSAVDTERWITIGADKGEPGHGTHVKISGDGKIVAGPSGLADKGIRSLSDFGKKDKAESLSQDAYKKGSAARAEHGVIGGMTDEQKNKVHGLHAAAESAHRDAAAAHREAGNKTMAEMHFRAAEQHKDDAKTTKVHKTESSPTVNKVEGKQEAKPDTSASSKLPHEMSSDEFASSGAKTFQTAKGSVYSHQNGQTVRVKVPHEGHDTKDVGLKNKSDETHYVNPQDAKEIGMWQTLQSSNKRIVRQGDELLLTSKNPKTGQQGLDGRIKIQSKEPKVGLAPVELFDKSSQGEGWYRGNHPGNEITSMTDPKETHGQFVRAAGGSPVTPSPASPAKQPHEMTRDEYFTPHALEKNHGGYTGKFTSSKNGQESHYNIRGAKTPEAATQEIKRIRGDEMGEFHKHSVESAMQSGKPVPSHVLSDYPDLQKKYGKGEQGGGDHSADYAKKINSLSNQQSHHEAADAGVKAGHSRDEMVSDFGKRGVHEHDAKRIVNDAFGRADVPVRTGKGSGGERPEPVAKPSTPEPTPKQSKELAQRAADHEKYVVPAKAAGSMEPEHKIISDGKDADARRFTNEPNAARHFTPKQMAREFQAGRHNFAPVLRDTGIYTDERMAIIPPEKMKEQILSHAQETSRHGVAMSSKPEPSPRVAEHLTRIMDHASKNTGATMRVIGERTTDDTFAHNNHQTLLSSADGTHSLVSSKHVRTIQKMYPDATFHVPDDDSNGAVVVKNGGKTVGVLMPLAGDKKRPDESVTNHVMRVTGATKPVRKSMASLFPKPQRFAHPSFKSLQAPSVRFDNKRGRMVIEDGK